MARHMEELTHLDVDGACRMVDVSPKPVTRREAVASGRIEMDAETLRMVLDAQMSKGNVLEVARLAGIMGAKRTDELIPLCHSLPLASVSISFAAVSETELEVTAVCVAEARTGVEMEAMTAVSVACLTVYDMCKAVDRAMRITTIQLDHKSGGKSGVFDRDN